MSGSLNTETEVKIAVRDLAPVEQQLKSLGFILHQPRSFESNGVYDTAEGVLRSKGELIRLREVNGECRLTYKGPASPGKHKSREELETTVGSHATLQAILERLGYQLRFRYEKFRTEFQDGTGIVTLDETPVGLFLELEGSPDWIDRTATKLGWSAADYLTQSYSTLYLEYCSRNSIAPTHMTFPPHD